MLDWTTSFLSDETIIKPREKTVKQFLRRYYIQEGLDMSALDMVFDGIKMPRSLRGM
jgi:hypothetical protein